MVHSHSAKKALLVGLLVVEHDLALHAVCTQRVGSYLWRMLVEVNKL